MSSYIILIGLIVLIVLSPIAVGSVYIVTYSAMELIVFALLLIHLWTFKPKGLNVGSGRRLRTPESESVLEASQTADETRNYLRKTFFLVLPLLLFLCVVLFQFIPLPFGIIEIISPATAALYKKLGMGYGYRPLTLSVYATSIAFLKWAAYIGAFILVATFSPTNQKLRYGRWIKMLLISLFVVAFGEAIYGLYIGFNRLDLLLWFHRQTGIGSVAGTWINPDHFAGYMNLALFCSVGLFAQYVRLPRKRRKGTHEAILRILSSERTVFFWILSLGVFAMILATVFSLSRGAHISLFVGMVFLVAIHSMKKITLSSLGIIALVTVVVLWLIWQGIEPVIEKWSRVENALYSSRLIVWKETIRMFTHFPVFGTGLGTYELAFPPFKPAEFGGTIWDHAHNDYLEILCETGFIGFVLWFSFFALFLVRVLKQWFTRHGRPAKAIGAAGMAAVITVLVHSLVDFNLQIPANALALFVVMGLTWRASCSSF